MTVKWMLLGAVLLSLLSLLLYGIDKRRARKGQWRICEAALLTVGFFGGSMGALLGMYLFRHKTRHWYFWAINWVGLALLIVLLWHFGRGGA